MKNRVCEEWNEGKLVTAFDAEDAFIKADKHVQDLMITSLRWQAALDKDFLTASQYNELIENINRLKAIQAKQRESK